MTIFAAIDRNGERISVQADSIHAMAPDDETVDSTLLYLDDGVVTVAQPYDDLIDQLAADG